jgi:hypothetical protein
MLVFSNIADGKKFISKSENKKIVYTSLIEDIKDAIIFDLNFVTIFRYEKENIHHFLYKDSWMNSLNKALSYFEDIEDYELCIEIRDFKSVLEEYYL